MIKNKISVVVVSRYDLAYKANKASFPRMIEKFAAPEYGEVTDKVMAQPIPLHAAAHCTSKI